MSTSSASIKAWLLNIGVQKITWEAQTNVDSPALHKDSDSEAREGFQEPAFLTSTQDSGVGGPQTTLWETLH